MTSNTLHCHICQVILADNESKIKQHISSIHLNYRPYDCRTCNEKCNIFKTAMEEDMEAHIAASHSTTNSGYHVIKDQIKETELKAAIEECRRVSTSQLSPADTTIVWDHNPTLNSPADIDENVQVERDSKEHLRRVFISLGGTSTDTESISTEMKPENPETSQDIALVSARPEIEQNHNAPTMNQILPKTMYDLIDCPTLNDYQATLLPFFDQPRESQEIAPNIGFSHLNSINLYPTAISSDIMENNCEINTADHFHGTIEEVQDSNVTRAGMTTDQVSDNGNIQLSELNEIHTAVDPIHSGDITATTTSMPILAEIPLLKRAIEPNKKILSIVLKTPTVSLEPLQHDEMPLRLRGRNQIHRDFEFVHDHPVERKRSRLSRTEQIEESNSAAALLGDGQNQRQHGFGECLNKSETDDEESEYEWMDFDGSESDDEESGTNNDTLSNKSRAHDSRKENHRESNESKVQRKSRRKPHSQFKKKRQVSQCDVGAVDGEKRLKCQQCQYVTNRKNNLTRHMRSHREERPFGCNKCNYAAADNSNLIRHERTHTGEKPFKCQFCEFAATQKSSLTIHIRTHTKEKPFKCRFCEYATSQSNHLTGHNRIHTGEKPYKCRFCQFATAQSHHLTEHIRIHTGEKPYKCRFCQFATAYSHLLTEHLRIHSGEKPYKCRFCEFASVYARSLNMHMRTQHKDALKLDAANNKKNTARNMLNKSGSNDESTMTQN